MSRVVVFGALHHDVVVDAPRLPGQDETLIGSSVDYRVGGKGCNQAIAASRMGAETSMIGRIGQDTAAETVCAALDDAGVERQHVVRTEAPTGMSVAIALPDGEYAAVIVSGANQENDGIAIWRRNPRVVVIQNEVPETANVRFVEALPDDAYLIWNAAPARELNPGIANRTDLLVVNRVEARDLTGSDDPETASMDLVAQVRADVVVTLGADGLLLNRGGMCTRLPAPNVKVVSSHGAGDMFVGALAARLAAGNCLDEALSIAQNAAAKFISADIQDRNRITLASIADSP